MALDGTGEGEHVTSDVSLSDAIDRLIPARVWTGGFPTSTHIKLSMGEPSEWWRFTVSLEEIHDASGLVAHAAHREDRSAKLGKAFDRLAVDMQLELNQLWRVRSFELGQAQDYVYWGPVVLVLQQLRAGDLSDSGILLTEEGDCLPEDLPAPPDPLPTWAEVEALEVLVRAAIRGLDEREAKEAGDLQRRIVERMRQLGPDGLTSVKVAAEMTEWGPPAVWAYAAHDADGDELELEWEVDDIGDVRDYMCLTGSVDVTFDLSDAEG